MEVFRSDRFEIGINLENADMESIRQVFHVLRVCPDCGRYPDDIDELEDEVWNRYFLRDVE